MISFLDRQVLGFGAANAAAMLMVWGLGRPALWLDEAASAIATRRSWSQLWLMRQGTDAPLVPYYVLLKAQKSIVLQISPGAVDHLEVLLRWPSAVAMVVAAWVLVSWLRAVASVAVAVSAGVVLLLIEGVSRYGQEARPYALVLMMAIIATAVWWRVMTTRSIAVTVSYAACVAALVCLHPLAASLVLAHLIAALLIRRDELILRVLSSVCAAIVGVLVPVQLTVAALVYGGGASRFPGLTGAHLLDAFVSLFGGRPRPDGGVLIILLLSVIGLKYWNSPRYGDATRIAVTWAVIPLLVLVPAMALRPNLLLARYALFVVPGWAILAGLGVSVLIDLVARKPLVSSPAAIVTSGCAIALGALGVLACAQWPALVAIRTLEGHGADIRTALAQLDSPAYSSLPIVLVSKSSAVQIAAYAPGDSSRLINLHDQYDLPDIWPEPIPGPMIKERLRATAGLLFLTPSSRCSPMPSYLSGYRMITESTAGPWSIYLFQRAMQDATSPPASEIPGPALPCAGRQARA